MWILMTLGNLESQDVMGPNFLVHLNKDTMRVYTVTTAAFSGVIINDDEYWFPANQSVVSISNTVIFWLACNFSCQSQNNIPCGSSKLYCLVTEP